MPALLSDLAPISDATTEGVRVEVLSRHHPDHSSPNDGEWVFEYTVRITNLGSTTVKLESRHWIITDAFDNVREVEGPGVIGKQPVLAPGESFQYSSWCPLKTPTGIMRGTYQMTREQGDPFEAEIAPFGLRAPYTVH